MLEGDGHYKLLEYQELSEFENIYRQLTRKLALEWNKQMEQPISGSQSYILEKLNNEGPHKVSSLAEALGITAGAVTGLSDKLIASGLAERKRSEEDRRIVYLSITEHGREVLETFQEKRTVIRNIYFKDLPDEDIRHLIRIFKQVLHNSEEGTKE